MFTPWAPRAGPTGGAVVAWPPGHCSFTFAEISFAIAVPSSTAPLPLDRLHLPVLELDRGRPAEDRHDHPHRPLLGVHLLDGPVEPLEGPLLHLDGVPLLEADREARALLGALHLAEDLADLLVPHRDGLLAAAADEVPEAGGLAQDAPDALRPLVLRVVELRLDHEVAGVDLALGDALLPVLDLRHPLEGDQDLGDPVLERLGLQPAQEVLPDPLLAARLDPDHVPAVGHFRSPGNRRNRKTDPRRASVPARKTPSTRTVAMTTREESTTSEVEGQVTCRISGSVAMRRSADRGRSR